MEGKTAAGAGLGAAAGAAVGAVGGGPFGAAVGGITGAVVGGTAGYAAADVDPEREDAHWREHHIREPYYEKNYSWDDYRGAYRTGYSGYSRFGKTGRRFEDVEPELRQEYERESGQSSLKWEHARHAARAAWFRFDRDLSRYIDFDVVDRQDQKIGTLECLWSDHRGEPAFVGVKTGWFFGKTHVVPAQSAQVGEHRRRIRLPYDEQTVKDAPAFAADTELTPQQEEEVRRYYGISSAPIRESQGQTRPEISAETRPGTQKETAEIPLAEETLKVGKREVEAGGVRLRKIIRTEVVNQPVELQREEIIIERVPAEQAAASEQAEFEEGEIYIPLRREEAVIEKKTKVREVVRASKKRKTDRQEIRQEIRKEDIEINPRGEARESRGRRTPAKEIADRENLPRSQRSRKEE